MDLNNETIKKRIIAVMIVVAIIAFAYMLWCT